MDSFQSDLRATEVTHRAADPCLGAESRTGKFILFDLECEPPASQCQ